MENIPSNLFESAYPLLECLTLFYMETWSDWEEMLGWNLIVVGLNSHLDALPTTA